MLSANFQRRKTIRVSKKRARWRDWKRSENAKKLYLPRFKDRRSRGGNTIQKVSYQLRIPMDFSLSTNVEGVMNVVQECKRIRSTRYRSVFLDFKKVKKVGHGALTILLSAILDFTDSRIPVIGNYPRARAARRQLERSGFFKFLRAQTSDENKNAPNVILEKGANKTEQEKTAPLIRKSMKTVWGTEMKNTRLQGMMVELMANTINHAFMTGRFKKGWYLSIDYEEAQDSVSFCFLDNGEGILKTINLKFGDRLKQLLLLSSDNILKEAFDGKFGSRTRLTNRGRGLPAVKEAFRIGAIKNLKVISNNVVFDFTSGRSKILRTSFTGTFYYWTLDQSCKA